MSRADELYRQTCIDILENGFYDTDLEVRPRWADGTPAHTVKKFGVVNRYNLKEEFTIMTLRRTYWKSALDELPHTRFSMFCLVSSDAASEGIGLGSSSFSSSLKTS